MEFLVTGCAGFIGSHFAELLLQTEKSVIGVDNFDELLYSKEIKQKNLSNLEQYSKFHFINCPIGDLTLEGKELVIINFAALAGQRYSWSNISRYFEVNAFSPLNLYTQLSKRNRIHHFIQISTSSVYGVNATSAEDGKLEPISPYGISKVSAEYLLKAHFPREVSKLTIFRLFSVYGPRQRPDMAYSRIIDCLLNDKSFHLFGDGLQSRTNTFVDDVCSVILRSLVADGIPEVMNVGGAQSTTLLDAIIALEDISGKKLRVIQEPSELGDQVETRAHLNLIREHLGYKPSITLREGLAKQFDYAIKRASL
jgi:UDP-glucuronate 4-epimerase